MKISKETKNKILLESFEILKSNYDNNHEAILEIIGKMARVDLETAFDMWEYILDTYPEHISKNNNGCLYSDDRNITCGILSNILGNVGNNKAGDYVVATEIKSRPKIVNTIFGKSSYIDHPQCAIIAAFILHEEFESANEALQLIKENPYNYNKSGYYSLGGVIQNTIENVCDEDEINETSIEFLNHWIEQINDPQEQAKAMVSILDFM